MSASRRVVIVGAGFAGLAAARRLGDRDDLDVVVLDRRERFEFGPNIHEIVSGRRRKRHVRLSIAGVVGDLGHRFEVADVERIDTVEHRVIAGTRAWPYDAAILAIGGSVATRGVEGALEYATPLRSAGDARRIARRLEELSDAGRPYRVAIVGGGYIGVECLGEVLRGYGDDEHLSAVLVEPRGRLVDDLPREIHDTVVRLCADEPVEFRFGHAVSEVGPDRIDLARVEQEDEGGERAGGAESLPVDLVIWTAGLRPPALLARSGLAEEGRWMSARRTLQSRAADDVLGAGDAIEFPWPVPKQAYQALAMGRRAASNAERLLDGRPLDTFDPEDDVYLVTFGDRTTFLVTGDEVFDAPFLAAGREWILHREMAALEAGDDDGSTSWARLFERLIGSADLDRLMDLIPRVDWILDLLRR